MSINLRLLNSESFNLPVPADEDENNENKHASKHKAGVGNIVLETLVEGLHHNYLHVCHVTFTDKTADDK